MRNISQAHIVFVMQELIDNCEGAIMAAKAGSYLHNFDSTLQEKLRTLRNDVEYMDIEQKLFGGNNE